MLTNTASDQDSRAIQVRTLDTFCPFHPAALIAGVAGEGDASTPETLDIALPGFPVTRGTSSDSKLLISDQPASLCEPYTALFAAITATDRLIADGMQWGYLHAVSSLTGWGIRKTTLDADAPSTQRHSRAARLPPWRCVLSLALGGQTQRGRERGWVGECSVHAATRDRSRSATSARLKSQRPRFASPIRIARMPPTCPCALACRRTVDSSMPRTAASSVAVYVLRSGLRLMLAPALGEHRVMPLDD